MFKPRNRGGGGIGNAKCKMKNAKLWNAARGGIGNAKCKMQLPSGRKVTGKIAERFAGRHRKCKSVKCNCLQAGR
jgi:hypothetical protein